MINTQHIIALIDRSGSMYSMNGVQNSMNTQLLKDTKDTAEKNQTPTYLTFTTFDNVVENDDTVLFKILKPPELAVFGYNIKEPSTPPDDAPTVNVPAASVKLFVVIV